MGKWKDSKSKIRSKEKEKKKEEKANSRKSGSGPLLGSSSGATENSNRPNIEDVPFTPIDTNALFQKVLGMCGIVLSVKAQQQYFDNTKPLWLYYQDIVGMQTRIKFMTDASGSMDHTFM